MSYTECPISPENLVIWQNAKKWTEGKLLQIVCFQSQVVEFFTDDEPLEHYTLYGISRSGVHVVMSVHLYPFTTASLCSGTPPIAVSDTRFIVSIIQRRPVAWARRFKGTYHTVLAGQSLCIRRKLFTDFGRGRYFLIYYGIHDFVSLTLISKKMFKVVSS